MKKGLLLAISIATMSATAQVKVGSDIVTLATNANFQVEGTTAAEQFVVLKNGNVGIGTTTPGRSLTVVNTTSNALIRIYGNDNSQNGLEIGSSDAFHYAFFQEGAPSRSLAIAHFNNSVLTYPLMIDGTTDEISTIGKLLVGTSLRVTTTPTITTATKVLVKEPVTNIISEQDISLGNIPVLNSTAVAPLTGDAAVVPAGGGVIVTSPDGLSKWKMSVSNTGVITTTKML